MQTISEAMTNYFSRLFLTLNGDKLMAPNYSDIENEMFKSKSNKEGWSEWAPVKKHTVSNFDELESKFEISFHKSIIEYYNSYWFFELYGNFFIDEHLGIDVIELNGVIPEQEVKDLNSNILNYYRTDMLNNIRMIPIGSVQNLFIVVDNLTGEVFVDDQAEFGVFRKLTSSLSELISGLSVD